MRDSIIFLHCLIHQKWESTGTCIFFSVSQYVYIYINTHTDTHDNLYLYNGIHIYIYYTMGHGGRLANPQRLLSPSNCIERAARTAPGTVVGRAIASEDDQFS